MEGILAGPVGPLLIFLLRICDVSIATVRMISAVRGRKLVATALGFVEILIWVVVVGTVIRNLDSPALVVSYAAGFAAGTFVGMTIEEKLALGLAEVRVISRAGVEIAEALRGLGFGVTEMMGQGKEGPVEIISTIVQRRRVAELRKEVSRWDDEAFVVIEEPRSIERGWLLSRRRK
ncbi:MAG: DUF2179 domain-containing protein [Gemmatimonadetes bacterium]|uniref:UPF0316 protein GWO12_06630 n=1 Tax=Candidatus Kutchimonas denitrificans TaxID=3056748 RepID=A0AAE5CCX4_9BACT|nr:DUF2179 domain-containing protein [Gemmatimonadota bacterium]NIR74774.1 DUF2179 domain-containing protein [Candidatus Kutchimonas denitrificans]NIS01524.1 DUF2179 domain-containing protein [Gemmatimonadota bacterium]NIT67265.1 DUF2179 domain-containing protein [Gemmatimonadota bacterium]NIU52439.1 DUF2179 domain-containing protein [Gemmatimonadota bacterium]